MLAAVIPALIGEGLEPLTIRPMPREIHRDSTCWDLSRWCGSVDDGHVISLGGWLSTRRGAMVGEVGLVGVDRSDRDQLQTYVTYLLQQAMKRADWPTPVRASSLGADGMCSLS